MRCFVRLFFQLYFRFRKAVALKSKAKTRNGTWCAGKVLGGWPRDQKTVKRYETIHGFLGELVVRRSTQNFEKRHGFLRRVRVCRLTQKQTWNASWFAGKDLVSGCTKKTLKRQHGFWEGVGTKKLETPHGFLGKFPLPRWTHKKNLNTTWLSGKVLGAKVDSPKKLETPHGFLERFFVRNLTQRKVETQSTHKKQLKREWKVDAPKINLKRHMVVWKGSCWEGRLTKKKPETPTWFLGRFWCEGWLTKRFETPHGFLGRFWVQKCHMVFHVFWEGLFGRSTPQHGSSCRCRLLGGFWDWRWILSNKCWKATWLSGKVHCNWKCHMVCVDGLGGKVSSQKKAGNVTLSLGRVWVGRPRYSSCCEGWLTKKMSVFPLCYCILFRCRLLAVFAVEMNLQKRNAKMPHGFLSLSLLFYLIRV